ncbi:hypothetical protein PHMEG_0005353 [Phytophthora megakarya]|uniref:Uncharacterized protein n=1 Tax=Phytophthora megakarya TaxID=4795 RepID=A0A225WRP6_9STRA|nr:hypothetical protein PHMEG_0005353 [Phytophthora megakarya]
MLIENFELLRIWEIINRIECNVAQIKRGDLYVSDNTNNEGGGPPVRIVSTSSLERFHLALKKVLAHELNIDVGARLGRNPSIVNVDLVAACRAATEMFQSATVNSSAIESNLAQSRHHLNIIRELLFKTATVLQTSQVPTCEFMHSLRMNEGICEVGTGFSFEEHERLRQIVGEQIACGRIWDDCPLVTTITYNLVVASNSNLRIKLHRRSYRTLEIVFSQLKSDPVQPAMPKAATHKQLFQFRFQAECT